MIISEIRNSQLIFAELLSLKINDNIPDNPVYYLCVTSSKQFTYAERCIS